jgi:hypothetical protein
MAEMVPQGGGGVAPGKRPSSSAAILAIALELLAVGIFTLLAGAGPQAGRIMVLVMVTLWIIFAISNTTVISGIGKAFASLSTNPTDKK